MDNGDGTHTREIWYNCWDCGASWSKYSTEEHYGDSGMRYYTDNGDGTHTSWYECSGCWARCDEVVESCYDNDGDGNCDMCLSSIP